MSTKLADLAVGDTITVKHTVKVEKIGTGSVQVRSEDGSLYGYDDETARFKLVEKAPLKVGDVIARRVDLSKLPVKAVVVNNVGNPLIVKGDYTVGHMGNTYDYCEGTDRGPYEVVYLP